MSQNSVVTVSGARLLRQRFQAKLEDGSLPVYAAKHLQNVSGDSGIWQSSPFTMQAVATDNNTTASSVAPLAKQVELRGNTIIWGQLAGTNTGENTGLTITEDNGTYTISGTSTTADQYLKFNFDCRSGHKYLAIARSKNYPDISDTENAGMQLYAADVIFGQVTVSNMVRNGATTLFVTASGSGTASFRFRTSANITYNNTEITPQLFDLTDIFGARKEPTTLTAFSRQYNNTKYPYSGRKLLSCKSNKLVTIKYNQLSLNRTAGTLSGSSNTTPRSFDENKYYVGLASNNYYGPNNVTCSISNGVVSITSTSSGYGVGFPIRVIPGYEYTLERTVSDSSLVSGRKWVAWYDANGNYLGNNTSEASALSGKHILAPADAYWGVIVLAPIVNVATTFSSICFHFTWDDSRNGFEEYIRNEYTLPNEEMISAGSAYNSHYPSGKKVQRIESVDLSTLSDWRVYSADNHIFSAGVSAMRTLDYTVPAERDIIIINCAEYRVYPVTGAPNTKLVTDMSICQLYGFGSAARVYVRNTSCSTTDELKAALSGVILYYQLANSVETTGDTFTEGMNLDDYGVMWYEGTTTAGLPQVPQGNEFFYSADYSLFLDDLNNYTNGDVESIALKSDITVNSVNGQVGAVQTYKGEYSATAVYYVGDMLLYSSVLYLCIQQTTVGTLPTNTSYFVPTGTSIPEAYLTYLDNATYEKPVIASFTMTPSTSSYEIGQSVSITGFTHYETNIDHIATLVLKTPTDSTGTAVTPSSSSATVSISETVTSNTVATKTYTLAMTDTKGNYSTWTKNYSFYIPSYIGALTSSSITASNIDNLSLVAKTSLASSSRSVTVSGTSGYVYFVSTTAISKIFDADTGFQVGYQQLSNVTKSINGVSTTFKVYRTDELLAGTYNYKIED